MRLLVLSLLVSPIVMAQRSVDPVWEEFPESVVESVFETTTDDEGDSQVMDVFTDLLAQPLDLNVASAAALSQIPEFTPVIVQRIMEKRERESFRGISELAEIEGITSDILQSILPFLVVRRRDLSESPSSMLNVRLRSRIQRDIRQRRGFREGLYKGSSVKTYNRIVAKLSPGDNAGTDWELGLLTEKDAGEQRLNDFMSGYVRVDLNRMATTLLAGDYVMESGRGLVFWRSTGIRKGSDVTSPARRKGIGMGGYRSSEENRFFRGVAAETILAGIRFGGFYSDKRLNGTVDSNGTMTSIDGSGLFRTDAEIKRKGAGREMLVGGQVSIGPLHGLDITLKGYRSRFQYPLSLSGESKNQGAGTYGCDVGFTSGRSSLFGEVAMDRRNAVASVAGAYLEPIQTMKIVVVGRIYPRRFHNIHGLGFGESDGLENERGVYVGMALRAASWLRLSSFYDHFVFPWGVGGLSFSSSGNDFLFGGEIRLHRKLNLIVQYREINKPVGERSTDLVGRDIMKSGNRHQQRGRVRLIYDPSGTLIWSTRLAVTVVRYTSGTRHAGFLMCQDIRWSLYPNLDVRARMAFFDTDSFDSRLYAFESDVKGTLTNPALYGKGIRVYVLARYVVWPGVDVWGKYSATVLDGARTLGTGLDEIQGDTNDRITFQVDVRL